MFEKIRDHVGHDVVCVMYGKQDAPWNVAIECETCGVVIYDINADDAEDDE